MRPILAVALAWAGAITAHAQQVTFPAGPEYASPIPPYMCNVTGTDTDEARGPTPQACVEDSYNRFAARTGFPYRPAVITFNTVEGPPYPGGTIAYVDYLGRYVQVLIDGGVWDTVSAVAPCPSGYYNYTGGPDCYAQGGTCPANAGKVANNRCECSSGYRAVRYTSQDTVCLRNPPTKNDGSCGEGNPCNPATGIKTQRAPVYGGPGAFPLSLQLAYNSHLTTDPTPPWQGIVGSHWMAQHERRLQVLADGAVLARRPDGREWLYQPPTTGSRYTTDADINDRLDRQTDAAGTTVGWRLTAAANQAIEQYDATGRLQSVTSRSGLKHTFDYSDAATPPAVAPRPGLPIRATDAFGRTLSLHHDAAGRLATVADPAGLPYTLQYDAANNMAAIGYPDGTQQTYHYNEPANINAGAGCPTLPGGLPNHLTGITDEEGHRFATYQYDCLGRAVATQHAGNANRWSFAYNTNGTTDVTDPLNTVRNYGFQTVLGVARNTGIAQACAHCRNQAKAATHDANGNVTRRDDFNGNRVCRLHDAGRNLETVRVEGLTTSADCAAVTASGASLPAGARKTSSEWHPDWNLPTKQAEPRRIMTYVYNGQPDPTAGNALAACAPASALLPDGKPIAVLCKQIEQTTSDANGARAFAVVDPNAGTVLPIEGDPDPWFDRVSLLLHMDGTAGGTDFPDSSPHARAASTVAGTLVTDPTNSKYGSAAGNFTGGYLWYPPSSAWDMGAGDFTVEMWAKFNTAAMYSRLALLGQGTSSGGNQTFYIAKNTANQLTMALVTTGTSAAAVSASTVAANTWYHLALVRHGNTLTLYKDGAIEATAAVSGTVPVRQTQFGIGVLGEYTAGGYGGSYGTRMMGWLDEVRITKGVARYTGSFTVPAKPFGDENGIARHVSPVRVHSYTYNEHGQVLTARDPLNNLTTYAYYGDTTDEHIQGDLQSVANASGQVTRYTRYDKSGRVLQSIDANGAVTDTTYTPRGWVKTVTVTPVGALPQETVYDYDGVGLLKKATLSDGTVLEYSHDAAHRLTGVKDAAGNSVAYTLDNVGNRTGEELKDPSGALARSMNRVFDALNRVQSATGGI